jgi:hypothetical protein
MEKKEESCSRYANRILKHNKIEDIAVDFREFIHNNLEIREEYTFGEFQEAIQRKHLNPDIKSKLSMLCTKFEELEYRPRKPSPSDIDTLKKIFREVIKDICPGEPIKKKKFVFKPFETIKKQKITDEKISKRVDIEKKSFLNDILSKLKNTPKTENIEIKEIQNFVIKSRKVGHSLSKIKKELKDMGFQTGNIEDAMKKMSD